MANIPYMLYGIITLSGVVVNGATVRARNETSNELISTTTDSNGQYLLDAANFASGYLGTDKITVYVIYTNYDGSSTLSVASDEHEANIALVAVADSSLIYYCTVQDVYDELNLTSTDIAAQKIIKVVQRSEARINERTHTRFTSTTVTNEYYDFNQFNSVKSPEQLENIGYAARRDYWNVNYANKFRLNKYPIISITSISKNGASASQADSWTALTEQSGSGGDFEVDLPTGWVTFITNIPRYGKRAIRASYVYGHSTVPKQVERLTIMLTVNDILRQSINFSSFNSASSISITELGITNSSGTITSYLNNLNTEIDRAWEEVGTLIVEIS